MQRALYFSISPLARNFFLKTHLLFMGLRPLSSKDFGIINMAPFFLGSGIHLLLPFSSVMLQNQSLLGPMFADWLTVALSCHGVVDGSQYA